MVKKTSRPGLWAGMHPGKEAARYLVIAAMTGLLVGCGGGSGDSDPSEGDIGSQDLDGDLIPNAEDSDADGDGIDDIVDSFVDLDGDGLDDTTFLTEEQANGGGEEEFVEVSSDNPCGSEVGTDNSSADPNWNNNCVVKRSSQGGQFADSLFSVGIQRVLFCTGHGTGNDYTDFADGEYGPGSETAAKSFQTAESLTSDGVIGPQTWARLQEQVERLVEGEFNSDGVALDTYGFSTGACAGIPMLYQQVTPAEDGLSVDVGGWELAKNQPNESITIPFSYEEPFGRLR